MTNDKVVMGGIFKCPECEDGYMIVKKSKNCDDRFYGCTNYDTPGIKCKCVRPLENGRNEGVYRERQQKRN